MLSAGLWILGGLCPVWGVFLGFTSMQYKCIPAPPYPTFLDPGAPVGLVAEPFWRRLAHPEHSSLGMAAWGLAFKWATTYIAQVCSSRMELWKGKAAKHPMKIALVFCGVNIVGVLCVHLHLSWGTAAPPGQGLGLMAQDPSPPAPALPATAMLASLSLGANRSLIQSERRKTCGCCAMSPVAISWVPILPGAPQGRA